MDIASDEIREMMNNFLFTIRSDMHKTVLKAARKAKNPTEFMRMPEVRDAVTLSRMVNGQLPALPAKYR